MATKLFLRNTTTNGIDGGGSVIYYDMLAEAGASADTDVVDTAASGTEIQWTQETTNDVEVQWVSGRAPAGGFTLTATDISIWAQESNMSANCGGRYRVFKRESNGTETELGGGPFNDGVEFSFSAATEMTWTGDPTDTAFAENDRILLKVYITNVGTMASGHTCTLTFNAADAATGDSFFNIAETVTFKPEPAQPAFNAFRFYDDGTESGSDPLAAQDTDITFAVGFDAVLQLRVRIDEIGGGVGETTDDYALQYSKNGGAFTAITAATTNVQAYTGSLLTDGGATTDRATNGISNPGAGSFVAGEQEEANGTIEDHQLTAGNFTEHVWALKFIRADVADGDTFDFRVTLNDGTPGMTNNVVPTVTVKKNIVWEATLGNTQVKTAASSITHTVTATVEVGKIAIIRVQIDNLSTTDGETNDVMSITDSTGGNTWEKVKEHTNSNGAAGAGATVALFKSAIASQLTGGSSTVTANFSGSVTARTIAGTKIAIPAGQVLSVAGTIQTADGDAASPAVQSISGLTTGEYWFDHLAAHEGPPADIAATNFSRGYVATGWAGTSGGVADTNMTFLSEFRTFWGTGDSVDFNPTTVADHAQIFVAFKAATAVATPPLPTIINQAVPRAAFW